MTERDALAYLEYKLPIRGYNDPLGVGCYFNEILKGKSPQLYYGQIIIYNPQSKTASVRLANETLNCMFSDDNTSQSFGYSFDTPPREGDFVLVYPYSGLPNRGIVVGRIPYQWNTKNGDLFNDPEKYHRRSFVCDLDNTDAKHVQGYALPLVNKDDPTTQIFTQFRPTDINQGEMGFLNQHNCGFKGGFFSAALHGGGAILRLSALTNAIRASCEHYMRFSMASTLHEFHNGRYLSTERNTSLYQEERLGWYKPDSGSMQSEVWSYDSEKPNAGLRQTSRPRIKELSGFFGHLYSRFCLRPDPDDTELRKIDEEATPKEAGVSRETIDPSGQYRLSAAGMIAIERTGRIPVPVRIALPTDKDHDIKGKPEILRRFEHDKSRPGNRRLELYDRQAYDLKTQYARVDGNGLDKPDYYVPQEDELKPLKDRYDERFFGNETVELEKYDKRRAGIYIGEDGSVIIRDAWGSEVSMVGGNVTVSCAENVIVEPGKSALTIAGDDIVQKAQNSVDIHASEHDIRLSAARNAEIIGGADGDLYQGGVVIESKSRKSSPWDGKDKGESAELNGITFKANGQNIVTDCKGLKLISTSSTVIASGSEDSADGSVYMSGKNIALFGESSIRQVSKGYISSSAEKSNTVVGKSATFAGSSSATFLNGPRYPIPLKWQDAPNAAEDVISRMSRLADIMDDMGRVTSGYGRKALDKMVFGFRTSEECRTLSAWETGVSDMFYLYEPAWLQVKDKFETLIDGNVESKVYEENGLWDNGRPFPGKEADESAKYFQLDGLAPENITDDGFNRSREDVDGQSKIVSHPLKNAYMVRMIR